MKSGTRRQSRLITNLCQWTAYPNKLSIVGKIFLILYHYQNTTYTWYVKIYRPFILKNDCNYRHLWLFDRMRCDYAQAWTASQIVLCYNWHKCRYNFQTARPNVLKFCRITPHIQCSGILKSSNLIITGSFIINILIKYANTPWRHKLRPFVYMSARCLWWDFCTTVTSAVWLIRTLFCALSLMFIDFGAFLSSLIKSITFS